MKSSMFDEICPEKGAELARQVCLNLKKALQDEHESADHLGPPTNSQLGMTRYNLYSKSCETYL